MREALLLSGTWDFRLDGEAEWRAIPVPGCWEQLGVRRDLSGPAWYRTRVPVPAGWDGRRLWLRFGAVSYHCEIFVNGRPVGTHTGLWDAFEVEVTAAATPGETFELLLRVEKPAGLMAGPDSPALPGRFPLRETLAGFLPYVCGHIFGGIWQDVELIATGQIVFEDVLVRGDAGGRVVVEARLSAPAPVAIELRDPDRRAIYRTTTDPVTTDDRPKTKDQGPKTKDQEPRTKDHGPTIKDRGLAGGPAESLDVGRSSFVLGPSATLAAEVSIEDPRPWSPADPALYEARLSVADGDERVVRFGLRSLRADGTTIVLNGQPIYPRLALAWGWYPDAPHANPSDGRMRADFERLRSLGYNGVKLCLWFPPRRYFELADELGMLLWVELPMWIPRPSALFRAQAPVEYDRLMRQARQHPSAILYTVGCELTSAVDSRMLAELFELVKRHAGDALVRDNSGSGEAYGGLLNEHAEFYDYHFYAEPQHFRGLLDYFSPRWRPAQPWLFGEFCEADTFRDLSRQDDRQQTMDDSPPTSVHRPSSIVHRPWWTLDDPALNPQGARWIYELPHQERRLRASGLWERGEELERIARRQALWHRKYVLELARLYREVAGYVVTGAADTPIGAVGMLDDWGVLKFDPAEFRAFNADLVVLAGWDRRRAWVAGGDRAAPWDVWSYPAGVTVRPHLIASHYGTSAGPARVAWSVAFPGEPPLAAGHAVTSFALAPGQLRELTVAEFAAPAVDAPRRAILTVTVEIGRERAENTWPLWFFPRATWHTAGAVVLHDPAGRLRDLGQIAHQIDDGRWTIDDASDEQLSSIVYRLSSRIVIATAWTRAVREHVERGGRAVLLLGGAERASPLPLAEAPFWREAIRLAEPHPAWGDFPLDDALALPFLGCAADHALDLSAYPGEWRPLLRRLDARSMRLLEYAAELAWGAGRMIVSTLRIEGGMGSQPLGIARSTAAAHLLWCWVRYLKTTGP